MKSATLGIGGAKLPQRACKEAMALVEQTCSDPKVLPAGFAGRRYDARFLEDLPAGVDPCGENGEFHTFVCEGPMFAGPIPVQPGGREERDGFVFRDMVGTTA
ncbi:MAG: hypothetical protein ACF8TS_03270 [Maioricimonas sp. JB049]